VIPVTVNVNVPVTFDVGDAKTANPFELVFAVTLLDTAPDHVPVTVAPLTSAPLEFFTVTVAVALRTPLLTFPAIAMFVTNTREVACCTVIVTVAAALASPPLSTTVSLAEYEPAVEYVFTGFAAVDVVPSPNTQL
jgi:hypothetical protein